MLSQSSITPWEEVDCPLSPLCQECHIASSTWSVLIEINVIRPTTCRYSWILAELDKSHFFFYVIRFKCHKFCD